MADAAVVRLLIFRVGNLVCAAEADAVREILPRLGTTRIPGAPAVVAGVVNLRGALVTGGGGGKAPRQPAPARGGRGRGRGPRGPTRRAAVRGRPQSDRGH